MKLICDLEDFETNFNQPSKDCDNWDWFFDFLSKQPMI